MIVCALESGLATLVADALPGACVGRYTGRKGMRVLRAHPLGMSRAAGVGAQDPNRRSEQT